MRKIQIENNINETGKYIGSSADVLLFCSKINCGRQFVFKMKRKRLLIKVKRANDTRDLTGQNKQKNREKITIFDKNIEEYKKYIAYIFVW